MKIFFTLLCFFLLAVCVKAQFPHIVLDTFSTGYSSPLGIENCGDSRLFIVQRSGQIIISNAAGKKLAQPFLDIRGRVSQNGGEQGLLGLAFDPHYKENGFFYVNYIDLNGNTQISRFNVGTNRNIADAASEKTVLQVTQPFSNHNGGCLRFGADGFLYIGLGDGGSGGDPNNNAQNTQSFLGKLLRINVHGDLPYKIPATNPFKDSANYFPEIWALGLRNPWRFSFDSQTGDLWIGDVGQDEWEEVDMQTANDKGGENYGWRCYEGLHTYNTNSCNAKRNYTFPLINYSHDAGDCSITGGFVYRGSLYANMKGRYFFTDYCTGNFRMLYKDSGDWKKKNLFTAGDSYVTFGEDSKQELYVANVSTGIIYHLRDKSSNNVAEFSKITEADNTVVIYPNPSTGSFNIQYTGQKDDLLKIDIYNSLGKAVYSINKTVKKGTNNLSINLLNTVKGNYFVQLTNSRSQTSNNILFIK